MAVHVETPAAAELSEAAGSNAANDAAGQATGRRDGHAERTELADELIHYARSRNVTKSIVGKPKQPRWKELLRGSLVYELTRKCGDIDIYVISGDPERPRPARSARRVAPRRAGISGLWPWCCFARLVGWQSLHGRPSIRPTWP